MGDRDRPAIAPRNADFRTRDRFFTKHESNVITRASKTISTLK